MDRDALEGEVEEWVAEDIITEEQATTILDRYERRSAGRSRVVLVLSLVGAALVFVGITFFLATNWRDLPVLARAAILVAAPTLAYAGGVGSYSRDVPQVGHALAVLGALLVGPSLFLFVDLYTLGVETAWLLFGWAAVALSTGHALDSRPGTGLGLALAGVLVVDLAEPTDPMAALGLAGVTIFGLGLYHRDRVGWTYRLGGMAITILALLAVTTQEGRYEWFALESSVALAGAGLGALGVTAWLLQQEYRAEAAWAGLAIVAVVATTLLAWGAPDRIPALVAFAGGHLALLGTLVAAGGLGVHTESRALVDLATLGGLLQVISFVNATVIDELSGALALVVAGLLFLAAALAIERGRRSLLSRFGAE